MNFVIFKDIVQDILGDIRGENKNCAVTMFYPSVPKSDIPS